MAADSALVNASFTPPVPLQDMLGGVPSMTALSVPQHKLMCALAFGGSTRID